MAAPSPQSEFVLPMKVNQPEESEMPVEWTGDLEDDCTARWCGLLLRAEWMNGNTWWWAVRDLATEKEIDSSNNSNYVDIKFNSGNAARQAAEKAANEYYQRLTATNRQL